MIPNTNTLLDAARKPAAVKTPAGQTQFDNGPWIITLLKSDKLDKNTKKLGGKDHEKFRPAINEFVGLKVRRLVDKLKEKALIDSAALDLNKADRDRIEDYGHYHLKVGAESGSYVLFYLQDIDSAKREVRLSLATVTLHGKFNTHAAQARLLAGMPKNYTQIAQYSTDQLPPGQVFEAVENPTPRVLFSWLKRLL